MLFHISILLFGILAHLRNGLPFYALQSRSVNAFYLKNAFSQNAFYLKNAFLNAFQSLNALPSLNAWKPPECKNCLYFRTAYILDSMKWGRCKKFKDFSDYCRKDRLRCGWVGKYFIHKKYGNSSSNTGFLDTYFTYADLMIYNKTLDGNETEGGGNGTKWRSG